MPEWPELSLAGEICNAYTADDFLLIIIYGPLRMGKSAYAMKVIGEVYDYFFGEKLSIDLLKEFMGWHPAEVIANWYQIEERIPVYIWDDAGYWLYSMDWNNPLLKAVQKYFNVIGTDMNCLILTTPDPTWILSKLINMPGTLRGNCMKSGNKSRWGRVCRGYKPYRAPDLKKTGVNTHWEDRYSCKIPQGIYDWYKPIRDSYAKMAKKQIIDQVLGVKSTAIDDEIIKNLNYLADKD